MKIPGFRIPSPRAGLRLAVGASMVAAPLIAFIPAANAAAYSGYSLSQLRTDCDAYGTVESPYGGFDVPGTSLVEGDSGVCVALVQLLIDDKYPTQCAGNAGLALDGDDGPLTNTAVRCVQNLDKIQVDGEVGPYTWSVLWFVD